MEQRSLKPSQCFIYVKCILSLLHMKKPLFESRPLKNEALVV